jgi:hypothetical protein
MGQLKSKVRKIMFDSLYGQLLFYRIRIIREKLALAKYDDLGYYKTTYKKRFFREINLKNPQTYTEKLQWLKLFYRDVNMPICSDKYAVRKYLSDKGYGYLLNDIIGVYDNANKIDYDLLPNKFVAKAIHGSGWNLICDNKEELDWTAWKRIMNSWLKLNLYVFGREWNYKDIPRQIIVEKFIEHEPLNDYKFMCFNGEPKFIQINNDFEGKHYVDFYDMNWNKADFTYLGYTLSKRNLDKPTKFDEMVKLAKELSKPFPYVRVDFYNLEDEIIFGEMTFFPGGGMLPLAPSKNGFDEKLGAWLNLPQPNHNLELYNSTQDQD